MRADHLDNDHVTVETNSRRQVMVYTCDICNTEMFEVHCRIICPNCGYQRDCSDP